MTIEQERSTLERKAIDVRSRLEDRIHEITRRVEETKQALDIAKLIREYPRAAAGIALGAGALMGLAFGGEKRGPVSSGIGALITGTALQLARNYISSRLGEAIKGDSASPLQPSAS